MRGGGEEVGEEVGDNKQGKKLRLSGEEAQPLPARDRDLVCTRRASAAPPLDADSETETGSSTVKWLSLHSDQLSSSSLSPTHHPRDPPATGPTSYRTYQLQDLTAAGSTSYRTYQLQDLPTPCQLVPALEAHARTLCSFASQQQGTPHLTPPKSPHPFTFPSLRAVRNGAHNTSHYSPFFLPSLL